MIRVEDIHKSFGDNHVLKGITTSFEQGKTNLIIGQSGSGKTVFMKSLLGLHEVDSGQIFFDDRDFSKMSFDERKDIRKEIGMVFQGSALFDSLTIEENVIFPLSMFTNDTIEQKRERANFCLQRVNLENVNERYPAELSGGMQKRVAIARAIAMNPKYLFLDEPNSGLDPKTAIVIDNLVQELTKEYQMTTIVNTHDMNSVMEIGENIILIKEGLKAWQGSNDELLSTNNPDITDFIFSSKLFQRIRKASN